MLTYRDRNGHPTTPAHWQTLLAEGTQIAQDTLPNGLTVSTVYVGHDPVYESRVYGDPAREVAYDRAANQDEALVVHAALIVRWGPPRH